jgi:ribokinase
MTVAAPGGRVLVLGSANMDLVVRQPRLPAPGETIFGYSLTTVPGGKGLNQAVAAARAGATVSFIGAVGTDAYGLELAHCLESEGIDVAGLSTVRGSTGTAHISVLDSGENVIVVVPGANAAVAVDTTHVAAIGASDYLVLQLETPLTAARDAIAAARHLGTAVVLTPAPAMELDDELLRGVDLLIPNEHEAMQLTGDTDVVSAARTLSSRTAGTVLVTLGSDGCLLVEHGSVAEHFPARTVDAVDTTAAGDTFVGALVSQLARGRALRTAIPWATAASSISVTRAGATTSMPYRDEIDAALSTP